MEGGGPGRLPTHTPDRTRRSWPDDPSCLAPVGAQGADRRAGPARADRRDVSLTQRGAENPKTRPPSAVVPSDSGDVNWPEGVVPFCRFFRAWALLPTVADIDC